MANNSSILDLKDLVYIIETFSSKSISIEELSDKFGIGNAFKIHGYEKNWMLHNDYYKYLIILCDILHPESVLELGTQIGSGAVALSVFSENVLTADVNITEVAKELFSCSKIQIKKLNKPNQCLDFDFSKFDLIFVDIDHMGYFEKQLHEEFLKSFKGIVLWDDIMINDKMKKFWSEVVGIDKIETSWHAECGFGITKYG